MKSKTSTNSISVVLAVYNEEANLLSCLESVKDLIDEIVIVDGGSTDKTVEVAGKFGARIIERENLQNFHINKNIAIDKASKDWILQLDADELVSEQLVKEIRQVTSAGSEINGYWIPRKNFFLTRYLTKGGQYPDYTLRLYKRGKGRLPGKDVHEQAIVEGEVGYLQYPLLHHRDKNFSIYWERLQRYTDLLATQLHQKGMRHNAISFIDYVFIKPISWFLKAYFRHRGYVDGFPGFIFALFSSLRFPITYFKLYKK